MFNGGARSHSAKERLRPRLWSPIKYPVSECYERGMYIVVWYSSCNPIQVSTHMDTVCVHRCDVKEMSTLREKDDVTWPKKSHCRDEEEQPLSDESSLRHNDGACESKRDGGLQSKVPNM